MAKQLNSSGSNAPTVPSFAQKENKFGEPWVPATPMWMYCAHPARWTVIDGKVVPQLGQQVIVDGVNQVEVSQDGRIRFARCKATTEERGWSFIPFDLAPDGESYLQAIDTRPQGRGDVQTAYISVFASAYAGDSRVHPDETALAEWLESLMAAGHVSQPEPHHVSRMLENARQKLAQAKSKQMGVRADLLQDEVEALQAWLDAHGAPKGKRATPKRAARRPKLTD